MGRDETSPFTIWIIRALGLEPTRENFLHLALALREKFGGERHYVRKNLPEPAAGIDASATQRSGALPSSIRAHLNRA